MEAVATLYYEISGNPVFITFLIISLGLALGSLRCRQFSLGVAGTFIIGFVFGALGYHTAFYITILGQLIFMYALGIQDGPRFILALTRKGIPYLALSVLLVSVAAVMVIITGRWFGLGTDKILGVFTGSLTSLSGLAILVEGHRGRELIASFGIVYPLGVAEVMVFVMLVPALLKKELRVGAVTRSFTADGCGETNCISRKFAVENPAVAGKKLSELQLREKTGAIIERVKRKHRIIIPNGETVLRVGDVALAVGTEASIEKVHRLVGNVTYDDMEIDPKIEDRQIVLTNLSLHHARFETLALGKLYHITVTRIWRGKIELSPSADLMLEAGDTLLAVGKSANLDRLEKFLGKQKKHQGEVDLISMAFGVAAGFILGRIPIAAPSGEILRLGNSSGSLIAGMVLGAFHRIGFLTDVMSPPVKNVLKNLGMSMFLAGIGAKAGQELVELDPAEIISILGCAVVMLSFLLTFMFTVSYWVFKMDLVTALSAITGFFVAFPALEIISSRTGSDYPLQIYAASYPVSLFLITISAQILAIVIK